MVEDHECVKKIIQENQQKQDIAMNHVGTSWLLRIKDHNNQDGVSTVITHCPYCGDELIAKNTDN